MKLDYYMLKELVNRRMALYPITSTTQVHNVAYDFNKRLLIQFTTPDGRERYVSITEDSPNHIYGGRLLRLLATRIASRVIQDCYPSYLNIKIVKKTNVDDRQGTHYE